MGLGERKQKDSAMAADLKRRGVKRTQGRCPICNGLVALPMNTHIPYCNGRGGNNDK